MKGRSTARAVPAILAVLAFTAGAAGQSQPPDQPAASFRTSTNLVAVDVIARDGNDRFVTDLSTADFEVFEDGLLQPIMAVYLVGSGPAAETSTSLGVNVERVVLSHRILVLAFDDDHLSPGAFKRSQDAARDFLTRRFAKSDIGGVVVGGKMANNRLTGDREELLAAVKAAKYSGEARDRLLDMHQWPRITSAAEAQRIAQMDEDVTAQATRRACSEDPSACIRTTEVARAQLENKARMLVARQQVAARRSLLTAMTLATGLGKFEGRKAVVLFSDGFQLGELAPELRDVIEKAARAGVTFYAIDTRGTERSAQRRDFTEVGPSDPGGSTIPWGAYDSSGDPTNAIATDTGGFVVRNMNTFGPALERIADDASQYYVLGYAPSNTVMDGSFRRIEVKVRRPGLSLRARPGYVATPDAVLLAGRRVVPAAAVAAEPPSPSPEPLAPERADPPTASTGAAASTLGSGATPHLRPRGLERKAKLTELAPTDVAGGSAAPSAVLENARKGWERYEQGDVEGAKPYLEEAASSGKAPPWVVYALGLTEFAQQRFAAAAAAWERVVRLAPEFKGVYFDLADAYLQTHDFDAALRVLRRAQQRWQTDAEVLNAIGVIQVSRGTLDAALETFSKALEAEPSDGLTVFNLGKTYELKYGKTSRYVASMQRWVRDETARDKAIKFYEQYLELGGPYENSARDGLQRLNWRPK